MENTNKKEPYQININWLTKRNIPVYLQFIYFLFVIGVYISGHTIRELNKGLFLPISFTGILICLFYLVEIDIINKFFEKFRRLINIFLLILSPCVSFLIVEVMVSNYNLEMFEKYGLFNLVWYALVYLFIYVLIRNCRITILVCDVLIYIASLINYLVYTFRGNPVLPSDLLSWKTGVSVASNYHLSFTTGFLLSTLIMLILFLLTSKLADLDTKITVINRVAGCMIYLTLVVPVFIIFFRTNFISTKIWVLDFFAPKYTYCSYGTAFSFIANVEALETKQPKGYAVSKVEKALNGKEETKKSSDVKPNIIVIMNEAFSDLSMIGDYKTNMDYLPNIRSLKDNTIKGKLYTSVFGGATSDTEYEFLTGNSMAVMPQNSVPYQQFVTTPTESLATTLKAQGYYNIAIHPFEKSGYKRDIVYPLLGFDQFLSKDDFKNPETIRSYISDKEDYKKIITQYKEKGKDSPLFIFNVTMQDHGGYSSEKLFDDKDDVKFTGKVFNPEAEQYLSLLRKSDQAFKLLISYFSKQKEPTLILLFGDHQPIAFSDFHDQLENSLDATYSNVYQKKYEVPFILWANYDIKGTYNNKEIKDIKKIKDIKETYDNKISVNYLSSYLLQTAGLRGTEYNKYLLDLYKKLPVINALFYIDKNNNFHSYNEPSEYDSLIEEYKMIGYNNVFDKKHHLGDEFSLSGK